MIVTIVVVMVQDKAQAMRFHKKKKKRSFKDFVKWCLVEPKVLQGIRIGMSVINPLFIFFLLEPMHDNLLNMGPNVWIFTWILLLGIQFAFFAVIGNMGIAMLVMDLILFPCGLANLVLLNVRGTPFLPSDLLALRTATEVASTYTISFTPAQFVILPAFILWCYIIFRFRIPGFRKRARKRMASALFSCLAIGI